VFWHDGVRVAPFKAQNMSNNAAVTADGGEIGRAQAEQAAAAGLAPTVAMNPVLLKPQGDRTSQLVVDGRARGLLQARAFAAERPELWAAAVRGLDALRAEYELVIAEGAGAALEPNLRAGDIVNLRLARHAGAAVLVVADIDRGGAFAHLLGTLELMTAEERALVRGFVLNRFRGDAALLAPAIAELEGRTGVPVLGVVPWLEGLRIAEEDAVALERADERGPEHAAGGGTPFDVVVARFGRIANFDDLDPLAAEAGVRVRYVTRPEELGTPRLIVLPGTKATITDLLELRASGLAAAIVARARAGTPVLGLCGGYQMLGVELSDPDGVEAAAGTRVAGLGLLPVVTTFAAEKVTRQVEGMARGGPGPWERTAGAPTRGYEIHMGRTEAADGSPGLAPLLELGGRAEGAVSDDGLVAGTYLHGLLHNAELRRALLRGLGHIVAEAPAFDREREFDRLAAHVRTHLDLARVRALLWPE
jgi:adenosylcobyric acid synthase